MLLSIVIPVFNESESLEKLHEEITDMARDEGYDLDIIFVDDGSTDSSWQIIEQLSKKDAQVRGIRFRRNFGKAAGLDAGFAAVRGERVMTLDADLQDDPKEIPRFLAKIDEGFDVVSGWKKVRHDPWHKVGPSRVFNGMVSWLTGVKLHDHNCGMKCYRSEVLKEVRLYGELHRFVPVLAAARGFTVSELVINHRRREFGKSKYGVTRIVKGFLDLMTVKFLTGFGQRPQHVLGTLGLIAFSLGFLGLIYLTGYWLAARIWTDWGLLPLHQRPALIYSTGLLLFGGQLMSMGFLAELMVAYNGRSDRPPYSIAETINQASAPETDSSNRISSKSEEQ